MIYTQAGWKSLMPLGGKTEIGIWQGRGRSRQATGATRDGRRLAQWTEGRAGGHRPLVAVGDDGVDAGGSARW